MSKSLRSCNQGKIVAEHQGAEDDDEWLVMFPDGEVRYVITRKRVEALAKQWFKSHLADADIGIGKIEWRR